MESWLASHSSHWRQLDQPSCSQLSCFHRLQDSSDCQLSCAMGQSKLENEECANCLLLIMLGPILPPEAIQAVIQPSTLPGHLFFWCSPTPILHKKVQLGCPKQQASASVKPNRGCLPSIDSFFTSFLAENESCKAGQPESNKCSAALPGPLG